MIFDMLTILIELAKSPVVWVPALAGTLSVIAMMVLTRPID